MQLRSSWVWSIGTIQNVIRLNFFFNMLTVVEFVEKRKANKIWFRNQVAQAIFFLHWVNIALFHLQLTVWIPRVILWAFKFIFWPMLERTLLLIILCRVRFIFWPMLDNTFILWRLRFIFCCPQSGRNCDLGQLSVGVLLIWTIFLILCRDRHRKLQDPANSQLPANFTSWKKACHRLNLTSNRDLHVG